MILLKILRLYFEFSLIKQFHTAPLYLIPFEEDASDFFRFWCTYISKNGDRKKINLTMAFGDSQLASAADSAKICSDWPGSTALVSRLSLMAIVGFQFFFFPQFGTYE